MSSHRQSQVVKTSVNAIAISLSQDYSHPDDHTLPTYMYVLALFDKIRFAVTVFLE